MNRPAKSGPTPSWVAAILGATLLLLGGMARTGWADENAAPEAARRSGLTFEELMHRMSTTTGVVARFREQKYLSLLKAPIESRGVLHFVPPDCLSWRVTSPGESALVIEGERVSFQDETSLQDLDLSGNPLARHFVEGFMVLFNGDMEAMQKRYTVEFTGNPERWSLGLVPRSARVRSVIASIALDGRVGAPERMVLVEADGDRTVTIFEQTEVDRRFDPAQLRELFGSQTACGPL